MHRRARDAIEEQRAAGERARCGDGDRGVGAEFTRIPAGVGVHSMPPPPLVPTPPSPISINGTTSPLATSPLVRSIAACTATPCGDDRARKRPGDGSRPSTASSPGSAAGTATGHVTRPAVHRTRPTGVARRRGAASAAAAIPIRRAGRHRHRSDLTAGNRSPGRPPAVDRASRRRAARRWRPRPTSTRTASIVARRPSGPAGRRATSVWSGSRCSSASRDGVGPVDGSTRTGPGVAARVTSTRRTPHVAASLGSGSAIWNGPSSARSTSVVSPSGNAAPCVLR